MSHIYFELIKQHHNWNKWIVCVQILVGLNWISFELLERQLVHEERIQSTATDKISTVTFRYLTLHQWIFRGYLEDISYFCGASPGLSLALIHLSTNMLKSGWASDFWKPLIHTTMSKFLRTEFFFGLTLLAMIISQFQSQRGQPYLPISWQPAWQLSQSLPCTCE